MGEWVMNLRIGIAAGAFLFVSPALADSRDEVLRAMERCAGISDKDQRLACYDQLDPQVKSALATPPKTLDAPPTAEEQKSWFGFDFGNLFGSAPAQQSTPEKFGSESLPAPPPVPGEPPPPGPIDSISAKVTDYAFTPFGKFIVFLDNGQVWRQLQGDADRATFPKGDVVVTVSRGVLGSYNLQIGDSAKAFKVKRVK